MVPGPTLIVGERKIVGAFDGVGGHTFPVPDPPQTYVGVTVVGAVVVGVTVDAPTAFAALTLPWVQYVPVPSILSAVEYNLFIISLAEAFGFAAFSNPTTPTTIGVAMEVPLLYAYLLPGTVEIMFDPGAVTSTCVP